MFDRPSFPRNNHVQARPAPQHLLYIQVRVIRPEVLEQDNRISLGTIGNSHAFFRSAFGNEEFVIGQLAIPYQGRRLDVPLSQLAVSLHCDKAVAGIVFDRYGLSRQDCLGPYSEKFGVPEFAIDVSGGRITAISVLRGAPCGATWPAANRVLHLPIEEAVIRIGLEVQYFCTADPSGWDPIYGKSPVHFAGDIHSAALKRALSAG